MTVLLVDDDSVYLNLLAEVLTLYSHTVLKASDGKTALDLLQGQRVDLIISDASMPSMDGLELHAKIREDNRFKNIPFAWNSAFNDVLEILRLESPELDFKFQKTMPLQELLYLVTHKETAKRLRERQNQGADPEAGKD